MALCRVSAVLQGLHEGLFVLLVRQTLAEHLQKEAVFRHRLPVVGQRGAAILVLVDLPHRDFN